MVTALFLFLALCLLFNRLRKKEREIAFQKKIMDSRLLQAQKLEAMGTLAGGIAHDFNNILVPVIVASEMLMEDL